MPLPRLRRAGGGDVTAPSPPRCARCGHELAKHYLSSTGIPPIPVCTACPGFAAPAKEFGWRHSFVPPAEQEGK